MFITYMGYKCGCRIYGTIGIDKIYLMNECSNEKNKNTI